jgi:hypothetical protein
MAQDYLHGMGSMDRGYYSFYQGLDRWGGSVMHPSAIHEESGGARSNLGPRELGTTVNPMVNQIAALQEKIRQGASRLEIGFAGTGKGNAQQATPEAYGKLDREVLRQIAEYNNVKTSTHAAFGVTGLAGFGQNGFSNQAQHMAMEEVKKAVDFASQATTGGAIVVHTGEWTRPVSETPWAKQDYKKEFGDKLQYRGYRGEEDKAFVPVVDARTGEIISGIRKDQEIYEPVWVRAKDYEKETGKKLSGRNLKGEAVQYDDNDFIDVDGNRLNPDDPDEMFRRLPTWDEKNTRFKVEQITWDKLVARAEEYRKEKGVSIAPEVLYAQIQIENQALQARGSSLYYASRYENDRRSYDALRKAIDAIKKGDYSAIENNSEFRQQVFQEAQLMGVSDEKQFTELVKRRAREVAPIQMREYEQQLKATEQSLRHVHEASSAQDVQAETLLARKKQLQTIEEYGLKQTGRALGDLGLYAMEKSNKMLADAKARGKADKYEKLYIAPENVFTEQYGSHPDELINVVEAGRAQMAKKLQEQYGKSKEEATALARDHIKSTLDIGHLNMWKSHMERKEGESDDAFHKRFETWALAKVEEMHKRGILGHIHLTDNLGFNDEHLTPGQGNAPIKSVMERLEKLGYKNFIAEIGSFNANTILPETWSHLGSRHFKPGYIGGGGAGTNFRDLHLRHFGGYAAPLHMVGGYVPSNDFTLWSQVPFE